MFLAWFEANKKYPTARQLIYAEMPMKFIWKQSTREFVPKQRGFSIGRVIYVLPSSGEMYYLRCLLNVMRGLTCYEDLRTVNGVLYSTYRDACYTLGLLEDDKEYVDAIVEASHWVSTQSLRNLFTTLLSSNSLSHPEVVWEKCWTQSSDGILYKQRKILGCQDLIMTEDEIKNHALVEIEKLLTRCGKSLRDYAQMLLPEIEWASSSINRMVQDELRYDRIEMHEEHTKLVFNLTHEQHGVYSTINSVVGTNLGDIFFVYGYGWTRKTFVWRTLSATLRSK
ncbi:uncharacterized protein LOC116011909 [Ipomoea triloba]|uniref:uncharacterized protein LOC116011909 n=1 Tax=Ipomoea triloba TaxID=35885 RepID=UPI00125E7F47|nr:uncharacterized protein LOC116011909 [Ipomoea triloba]